MNEVDLSANLRIPALMELMDSMNQFTDPWELLEAFVDLMSRAYPSRCFAQLDTHGLPPGQYRINRLRKNDGGERINSHAPWTGTQWPINQGGIFGKIVASRRPIILHELDLTHDAALDGELADYHSLMATPIFDNEIGLNWVVILDPAPRVFAQTGLEELILRANLVGAMVNNLDTARQLSSANRRIQHEIDAIGRIQKSLLPDVLPEIPGLRLAASYRTFDRAGGDLYDIARLGQRMGNWDGGPDSRWLILIGDVSGHGPAAAVVMAMFHSILHTYPLRPNGPAEVLTHVNRHLCAKRIEQSFVTAFLAFYDAATRQLTYARAGHNPPLLKNFPHSGSALQLNAVGELPLGIFHDVQYKETSITLHPGQTLILYTDGVTEARRPGGEMFGAEGLERALIACTGAPDCAIRHINQALQNHQTNVRPDDDQTVLAIQVL